MYLRIHVEYPLFLSFCNTTSVFSKFLANTHIKFHENPSSGSRVFACERTDTTKIMVVLHNFANAPKTEVFANSYADSEEVQWQDFTNREMKVNVIIVQINRHSVINAH